MSSKSEQSQVEESAAVQNKPNDKAIIKATGLGKRYSLGGLERQHDTLRDMLTNALSSPFKRFKQLKYGTDKSSESLNPNEHFWALKGVDFSISRGEIVGVIGHNGAGKSTLLKVLTRITTPTEGEVRMTGRVASLLEVGTGFHPELTGRENIYLNGAILGMSKSEISEKFSEIVAFAEVEKFLDTPVKRYSSGMYVRLAFAVAAHLDVDILLVDEVLAVGDQEFQKRCFGKLNEVSEQGRTVLFVSHNLSAVAKLCDRALVMDKGKLCFDGDIKEGIRYYTKNTQSIAELSKSDYRGELFPIVSYDSFAINGQSMSQGVGVDPLNPIEVVVNGSCQKDMKLFRATMSVRKDGVLLFSQYDREELSPIDAGKFSMKFTIPAYFLMPGDYSFSLGGYSSDNGKWLWTPEYNFVVLEEWKNNYNSTSTVAGIINIREFGEREKIS